VTEFGLAGRTALVTGAAGGLGLAMAHGLASAGAAVVLSDIIPAEHAEDLCLELEVRHGVPARYLQADLTHVRETQALVDRAGAAGPVDILVNNAVVRHFAPICDFPIERWNEALAVNLTSVLIATQRALPSMRQRDYGRIFNMTSVYGSRGVVDRIDYVTTKTAIQGMTRTIALEVAGTGVSCHALTPGSVLTPIWRERIERTMRDEDIGRDEAEQRFLAGKQPSGRFVDVNSVVSLMLLLCGPTGEDMNGAILPIEGGWLARA
jgi:3-hydroxybutyrate dehydrogenase